jgi:hypothetical protein
MNKSKLFAIVGIIGIIILCLLTLMKCEPNNKLDVKQNGVQDLIDKKQLNVDSLLKVAKSQNEKIKSLRDSVKVAKNRVIKKYIEAIQIAPDTCHGYINDLMEVWNHSDSVKLSLIETQENKIINLELAIPQLTDIITLKNYQIQQSRDSTKAFQDENNRLIKEVKKEKVKGNIKTVGASILSFFLGAGTSRLIP